MRVATAQRIFVVEQVINGGPVLNNFIISTFRFQYLEIDTVVVNEVAFYALYGNLCVYAELNQVVLSPWWLHLIPGFQFPIVLRSLISKSYANGNETVSTLSGTRSSWVHFQNLIGIGCEVPQMKGKLQNMCSKVNKLQMVVHLPNSGT